MDNITWVRPNHILPCSVYGTGIKGVRLEVFNTETGEKLEGNGMEFPDREALAAYSRERGYLIPSTR